MRGLLRKDLYVMDKQMRMLIILAVLFSMLPSMGVLGGTYAMMLAFMMPVSTISYDEKCRWDKFASMMPYTPRQVVTSKYILAVGLTALACLLVLVGHFFQSIYKNAPMEWEETLAMLAMTLAVSVAMTLLGTPVLYRFGAEKGRLVVLALVAVLGGGGAMLVMGVGETPRLPGPAALPALLLALAVLAVFSVHLSTRFYRNRQAGVYS